MKACFLTLTLLLCLCLPLSAQTLVSDEMEVLLNTPAVTYAQAARFILEASEKIITQDAQEAFRFAKERNWLPKKAEADMPARLDGVSHLCMNAFGAKRGVFYSITKSPHYAYRELAYRNYFLGKSYPSMNVSGEHLIFITGKFLPDLPDEYVPVIETQPDRKIVREEPIIIVEAEPEQQPEPVEILEYDSLAESTEEDTEEVIIVEPEPEYIAVIEEPVREPEPEPPAPVEPPASVELPAAPESTMTLQELSMLLTDINFMFTADSSVLRDVEKEKLSEIAEYIKQFPGVKLSIAGHTALAGTLEGRVMVSTNRARAVADYLIQLGACKAEDITITGYGAAHPAGNNATPEGRQANRRVEIRLIE